MCPKHSRLCAQRNLAGGLGRLHLEDVQGIVKTDPLASLPSGEGRLCRARKWSVPR